MCKGWFAQQIVAPESITEPLTLCDIVFAFISLTKSVEVPVILMFSRFILITSLPLV